MSTIDLSSITPKTMGEVIRQHIRLALHTNIISTTAEIAQKTGISFPTISKTLDEMNDQGEVLLNGLGLSSGGRRPKEYRLNPDFRFGLAICLEKDFTAYTLINYVGEIIEHSTLPGVLSDGPKQLTGQIDDYVRAHSNLYTLTFGVPGAVNKGRASYIPSFDNFKNFDFKTYYEAEFSIHVHAENDVNTAVYGYHDRLFNDKNLSIVYVYLGNRGIGAGVIMNGEVVRGSTSFSGEVSLLPLYDKTSFLQAFQGSLEAASPNEGHLDFIDAMSRLVATLAATINPHKVIFSGTYLAPSTLLDIQQRSAHYVPEENVPALEISEWGQDYSFGLHQLTMRSMLDMGKLNI
ncbi:ROK family protein [Paenibacillus solisilvae]|uniref:ROK family protein n=1 Tax=Paenibacillus solisilvae TaxID=2486751 RepID=A0ABW0W8P5_9BACL